MLIVVDQEARAAVGEDGGNLVRGEPRAQWHQDAGSLAGGEEEVEELHPVVREECHPVAGNDTQPPQGERGARRALVELAIRQAQSRLDDDQGRGVGGQPGALAQDVGRDHPAGLAGLAGLAAPAGRGGGGGPARSFSSAATNAGAHSSCGMWPQCSRSVSRPAGSSASMRSA